MWHIECSIVPPTIELVVVYLKRCHNEALCHDLLACVLLFHLHVVTITSTAIPCLHDAPGLPQVELMIMNVLEHILDVTSILLESDTEKAVFAQAVKNLDVALTAIVSSLPAVKVINPSRTQHSHIEVELY